MPDSVTVDIQRDLRAPASARRVVDSLSGRVADDLLADVRLLVSELITNSVKYGLKETVTLKLDVESRHKLHVEVIDEGSGFVPVARSRPVTQAGGWGLHLVQTLSSRWGVHEGLTHVWFEMDREEQAAA
jgi:anti-sigma regulatory factor (Ser/Thr protein kinase)